MEAANHPTMLCFCLLYGLTFRKVRVPKGKALWVIFHVGILRWTVTAVSLGDSLQTLEAQDSTRVIITEGSARL